MTEILLYKNKKTSERVQFPTEWGDLDLKELQFVGNAIYEGKLSKNELFIFLITNRTRNKKLIPLLDVEQCVIDGLPLVDFIIDDIKLTKNPMPEIVGNRAAYFGPGDNFEDMTCGEFEDSEASFFQLKEFKEEKYLNQILAALWRPKESDKRVTHFGYDIKLHVPFFEKIKFTEKIIIFLWYVGCRENIAKIFPLIFKTDGEQSSTPPALIFTNCIHMGAGLKNGTRENIRKMLLKEFLYDIHLQLKSEPKPDEK